MWKQWTFHTCPVTPEIKTLVSIMNVLDIYKTICTRQLIRLSGTLGIIPSDFLKTIFSTIEIDLLQIVNSSLVSGIFPKSFKIAVIKPLLKKKKFILYSNWMTNSFQDENRSPSLHFLFTVPINNWDMWRVLQYDGEMTEKCSIASCSASSGSPHSLPKWTNNTYSSPQTALKRL